MLPFAVCPRCAADSPFLARRLTSHPGCRNDNSSGYSALSRSETDRKLTARQSAKSDISADVPVMRRSIPGGAGRRFDYLGILVAFRVEAVGECFAAARFACTSPFATSAPSCGG